MECACVIGLPEVKVSDISSYFVKKLPFGLFFRKDMALVIDLVLWFGLGLWYQLKFTRLSLL